MGVQETFQKGDLVSFRLSASASMEQGFFQRYIPEEERKPILAVITALRPRQDITVGVKLLTKEM